MAKRLLLTLALLAIAAYAFLAFVGIEPQDRRPGTLLKGTVTALPTDWSTLAEVQEVHLQTQPWYGIPFSVTTVIAHDNGALYMPSLYDAPMPFPGTKYWNKVVAQDPNVRLRVGDALFEMAIYPITDAAEFDVAMRALGRKYPFWQEKVEANDTGEQFALLRLEARR